MTRSYVGLSLALSCCLAVGMGCGSSDGGGGAGGDAGTGGGTGGTGGTPPSGGLQTKDITLGCSNNVTPDISILPATLEVDSAEISGGAEFATTLSGTVFFPVSFLDVALSLFQGLRTAQLIEGQVIVQVRSGATEAGGTGGAGGVPGVVLVPDVANLIPGSVSFCDFSLGTCSTTTSQTCTDNAGCPEGETCEGGGENVTPCDQANDNPDGSNPACLPAVEGGPVCQDPVVLVDFPISEDCAPGGTCDLLGKGVCAPGLCDGGADDGNACDTTADCESPGICDNCPNGTQCGDSQFCVTGDLEIPLAAAEQAYTADASGEVLFGWADEGLTDPAIDACVGGANNGKACASAEDCPDGTCVTGLYVLPRANPATALEQGIVVNAGGINVKLSCVMAVDSAGPDGVAVCSGGDNDGASCESPADLGNDICFGGTNDGEMCEKAADCPEGECANADCGVGSKCEPTDLASYTPDSALIQYLIP